MKSKWNNFLLNISKNKIISIIDKNIEKEDKTEVKLNVFNSGIHLNLNELRRKLLKKTKDFIKKT